MKLGILDKINSKRASTFHKNINKKSLELVKLSDYYSCSNESSYLNKLAASDIKEISIVNKGIIYTSFSTREEMIRYFVIEINIVDYDNVTSSQIFHSAYYTSLQLEELKQFENIKNLVFIFNKEFLNKNDNEIIDTKENRIVVKGEVNKNKIVPENVISVIDHIFKNERLQKICEEKINNYQHRKNW